MPLRRRADDDVLRLTATTTGAATVTIQRLTPNVDTWIDWGDGSATARAAIVTGYTGTLTHDYAAAGVWPITVW